MLSRKVLIFLYLSGLYTLFFLTLGIIIYQIRKKKSYLKIIFVGIFIIFADIFAFNLLVYRNITLEHKKIKFKDQAVSYVFPQTRLRNLISEDFFHNFRPALYKKFVALSSYTIDPDFLKNSTIAKVYIHVQDSSLYNELDKLNIKEFIEYGFTNIDSWDISARIFFQSLLESVVEGFHQDKKFYQEYIDVDVVTGQLIKCLEKSQPYFYMKSKNWVLKDTIKKDIVSFFNLAEAPLSNYANKDYVILAENEEDIEQTPEFYRFIYNDISAREYLMYLFEKGISDEHTFVLLKDYYELVNSNKTYKESLGYYNLLSNSALKAMGVNEPILKYYPSAVFTTRDKVLSALGSLKSEGDSLYIESGDKNLNTGFSQPQPAGSFFYKVLDYNPNLLSLEYRASPAGYLYFSDSFDSYWNAYIDGKKTDIYKANVAFKAIKIPQGDHKVSFVYDPKYFRISLWCYYLAFAVCTAYLSIGAFINMRKS